MTERRNLLTSITNTIKDYRAGEIAELTPDHVDQWISQFDENVQLPILRELDHIFKFTYVSKDKVLHSPRWQIRKLGATASTMAKLRASAKTTIWSFTLSAIVENNSIGQTLNRSYTLAVAHSQSTINQMVDN